MQCSLNLCVCVCAWSPSVCGLLVCILFRDKGFSDTRRERRKYQAKIWEKRKKVLSSSIPATSFEWRERTEGRVVLDKWSEAALTEVLRFMYMGCTHAASVPAAKELLLAAIEFAMDELKGNLAHLLAKQLDQSNCLDMLRWAGVENNVPELMGPCLQAVRGMKVESREEAEGLLRLAADLGDMEGGQVCRDLRATAFERVGLAVRAGNCMGLLVGVSLGCSFPRGLLSDVHARRARRALGWSTRRPRRWLHSAWRWPGRKQKRRWGWWGTKRKALPVACHKMPCWRCFGKTPWDWGVRTACGTRW